MKLCIGKNYAYWNRNLKLILIYRTICFLLCSFRIINFCAKIVMRKESDEVYFERIAQEVLDSERTVLNNLELFSNICVRPAIEQAIIKQNSSLHKLFLLWELLRDLCQQYCTDLSKEPFHKTLFGHIVVDNVHFIYDHTKNIFIIIIQVGFF